MLNPAEPCFYCEDSFGPRLVNQIIQDHRVRRVISSVGYIGLVVLENVIFLDVARCCVHEQYALTEVAEYLVIENLDLSLVAGSHACFTIGADVVVLLNSAEVLFSLDSDSILEVLFNPVVPNDCIRAQAILCKDMDSIFLILLDFVHENVRIGRDSLDSHLALADLTELDLRLVTPLNLDSRTIYVSDVAPQDLWLSIHTLEVQAY